MIFTTRCYASVVHAVIVSVRSSVTRRYCTKMAKRTIRDVNRVPGPEKTTRSRVSNYPKATPASAFPLRNDKTAGTAGTVWAL